MTSALLSCFMSTLGGQPLEYAAGIAVAVEVVDMLVKVDSKECTLKSGLELRLGRVDRVFVV